MRLPRCLRAAAFTQTCSESRTASGARSARHSRGAPASPRVHVEDIFVDGKPVSSGATLPSNARNLEIRYTAPTFVSPDHVEFRYRLVGSDEQWVNVGTRRAAYYPFIQP